MLQSAQTFSSQQTNSPLQEPGNTLETLEEKITLRNIIGNLIQGNCQSLTALTRKLKDIIDKPPTEINTTSQAKCITRPLTHFQRKS